MGRATTTPRPARSMAGLLAVLVASVGALLLLALRLRAVVPTDADAVRSARVETWVELLVLTGGTAGAAWMLLSVLAALAGVAAVRRGRSDRTTETIVGRWAPAIVRRLARGAVGAGVGAGLALAPSAALADEPPVPETTPAVVLQLGWETTGNTTGAADETLPAPPRTADPEPDAEPAEPAGPAESAEPSQPDQPVQPDQPAQPAEPAQTTDDVSPTVTSAQRTSHQDDGADEVVVKRGDTLWDIAGRELPDDASPGDVLRAVTSWHQTNRDVIGDDPDVILPGQVLRAP
ncbi:LysM peptidoglycan-binding domain-containing protein [Isoptericola rhizosphaerae]|uniref:LysM peptidoglycan-binding domain-containing protein n=1 Tax=Isoptericola rhizosphaerae TaxID=3377837 RepID=UPI00383A00CC